MSPQAKLIYSAITSLDGYTADEHGNIAWSAPDEEVFRFVNDLERGIGTYLYGRRLYEAMVYWETFDAADQLPHLGDFTGLWRAAEKVVFSRTLGEVSSARTRIAREFDPATVRRMKETSGHDLSVGGSELGGQALAAGLVEEIHLFVKPVTVGGGLRALPAHWQVDLELLSLDRFESGFVHLHYRIRG